jgi:protein-S-isoprenylcysteine O-methyltransferase Ste14
VASALFALARSAVVATLFVSLWTWFVPHWIASAKRAPLRAEPEPAAVALMLVGGAIMLCCVWQFAWTGRGTPAPFDPPRRLVMRGPYRWVRNPMYIGMGVFLTGEAVALPAITREMLTLVPVLWGLVTLFIVTYEEPTLRRLFGADYAEYCRHVRRWIPRLTPFDNNRGAAVLSPDLD